MGAVEDFRKVMQDFLAPELRAIEQRVTSVETGLREFRTEFKEFRAELRELFTQADQRNNTRYQELVVNLSLDARLRRVEEKERAVDSTLADLTRDFYSKQSGQSEPDPEPGK